MKALVTGGGNRSSSDVQDRAPISDRHCNHPIAVLIDPTDHDLFELEATLAKCPNCSRWTPGDGPIMATLPGHGNAGDQGSQKMD